MDLIKYYPMTGFLLQDQIKKELTMDDVTYDKYSDVEHVRNNITYINNKIHGLYQTNNISLFNRGKLSMYVSDKIRYTRGSLTYQDINFRIINGKLDNYREIKKKLFNSDLTFNKAKHDHCEICFKMKWYYHVRENKISFVSHRLHLVIVRA